jgi:N-acetylglucosamine-6-phosphate deacetylase
VEASRRCLIHGVIHVPDGLIEDGFVSMDGPVIQEVGPMSRLEASPSQVVDVMGRNVIPGLIDLHIHGIGGFDAMESGAAGMAELLPQHGVTSFIPTTLSAPLDHIAAALDNVSNCIERKTAGAHILGAHLEGPFISPQYPGALDSAYIRPFDASAFDILWEASKGHIRLVTIAPEIDANMSAIPALVEKGIVVSMGHTDASFPQAERAVAAGANHATHVFNAMRGLQQREPGVLGTIFHRDEVVAELIGDGVHVHPAVMGLLFRVKGASRVAIISDAIPAATFPPGEYRWGTGKVIVDSSGSHLADGTIAGSVQLLIAGLRVLVNEVGLPFQQALASMTRTPAAVLGLKKGDLLSGYDADLVVLEGDLQPWITMVGGKIAFSKERAVFSC